MHRDHHVFLSYSRKDNAPKNPGGEGWVTAFEHELRARHQRYSGRELKIFFDLLAIDEGEDWKRRLGMGLRSSRLFLAFLSPNYITSKNCLWEWEEYLRHEHSAARGDDGITPIYFVTPDDLTAGDDQRLAAWLDDLNRRNRTFNCELHPWFDRGPEVLRQLDAAERVAELKSAPRTPADDPRTLAERLDALDRRIAARLDRITLAELAPGNVFRSQEHFVGRHRELSELHGHLVAGRRGLIAAAHGLGGQGKTALARQYAHAYAEFYAAGGTWELPCEGRTQLGDVLARLAEERALGLTLSEAERADTTLAARAVLQHLEQFTRSRVATLREELRRHPDRHTPEADIPVIEQPRCLLILDNVDKPELLSAAQIALLPAEEWLEIIVTTRLDPAQFGAGNRWQAAVHVDELPIPDALALVADFQPDRRFASPADEQAARELVTELGGYTLAVELVAAYLGAHPNLRPADYLARLRREGAVSADELAGLSEVEGKVLHKGKQLSLIVADTVARLGAPARTALEFASLLLPDEIPLEWLRALTAAAHPAELADQPGHPPWWPEVWRELVGRRLLLPVGEPEVDERHQPLSPRCVRIHRMVAQHTAAGMSDRAARLDSTDRFFDELTTWLEQCWRDTPAVLWQHAPLRDNLSRLLDSRPTRALALSAQVCGDIEGERGRLDLALSIFQRTLAVTDKLHRANPSSAQAGRDVSVSLNKLADFLAARGQPGDAAQALAHYQRSLEVREQLLRDNPSSAQAARDVSVSLNKLADFLADRGQPGDAAQALAHYQRCQEVLEQLLRDNPGSAATIRDVVVSHYKLVGFGMQTGDQQLATRHRLACRAVLHEAVTAGMTFDAPIMELYRQLSQTGGGGT